MGGLIPNPHDQNVSGKLDNTFSDPHLRRLRDRIHGPRATEPEFFSGSPGNPRHLHRISHRLKIWPDGPPPPPDAATLKGRWQYLLQRLLRDAVTAAQNGTTVAACLPDHRSASCTHYKHGSILGKTFASKHTGRCWTRADFRCGSLATGSNQQQVRNRPPCPESGS
jgi:hypothetical protein